MLGIDPFRLALCASILSDIMPPDIAHRIKKGDRVVIYMPMCIEAVVAMQACARIGAIHSVVFGGFSAKSLHERIVDASAVAIITADEQVRGGKQNPLKATVDAACGGTAKGYARMLSCVNEGSIAATEEHTWQEIQVSQSLSKPLSSAASCCNTAATGSPISWQFTFA